MSGRLHAGVDVGGSKIAVLVADEAREVVARHRVETGVGDGASAAGQIAQAVRAALATTGSTIDDLAAIGVGVPGRVDPAAGTVTMAVNLGWQDVRLGPDLEAIFGVPVGIENDVRAAAAGLHARGLAQGVDDLAYLGIGTGISAGIVLDGRLHRGARGLAGEVGHVVQAPDGPQCACGLRGCLEAVASGRGIAAIAAAALAEGEPSRLRATATAPTAEDVYGAAADGDPLATRITTAAGRHVAHAIHELVMTYDLGRVFLGGGVTHAGAAFLRPVEAALDELRAASPLAAQALPDGIVHRLPADAEPAGWGAVILAEAAASRALVPDGRR